MKQLLSDQSIGSRELRIGREKLYCLLIQQTTLSTNQIYITPYARVNIYMQFFNTSSTRLLKGIEIYYYWPTVFIGSLDHINGTFQRDSI